MNELTLEQTDKIAQFVLRHEIVFSHLCDDLIDHICCDLEDSMKNGADFDQAYRELKQSIGKTGLREIQEETLYAVDLKYRKMKRIMKISGVVGTVLLGLATLFKIQHWPLAGMMISLGALILISLFLPSSLLVLWKESKSGKRIFLFISAFLASALFIMGVLSKIQHWPGASIVLTIGVLTGILLLIPALVNHMIKNPDRIAPRWIYLSGGIVIALYGAGFLLKIMHWPGASLLLLISIFLIAALIVPSYIYYRWKNYDFVTTEAILIIATVVLFVVPTVLISFNVSRNFEDMFKVTADLNNRNLEFRTTRNENLMQITGGAEFDDLTLLRKETESLFDQIKKIEEILIPSIGVENLQGNSTEVTQQGQLFNYEATRELFSPGVTTMPELEEQLKAYINMVITLNGADLDVATLAPLDLNQYLPAGIGREEGGPHLAPVALIQSLGLLKGFILDAEAATIRNLTNKYNITK